MIETPRLLLRPIEARDLDAFTAIYADPEVIRFIGRGSALTPEAVIDLLQRRMTEYERQGYGVLAVVERATGRLIGRCGLVHWEIDGRDELEIGYIFARSAWGKGYATEAATAVRDLALGRLGRRRLISLIRYGNEASARVAEKLGMTHERDVDFQGEVARLFSLTV